MDINHEDWMRYYREIGKVNKYSAEQIAEYHAYIKFFAANPCRSMGRMVG